MSHLLNTSCVQPPSGKTVIATLVLTAFASTAWSQTETIATLPPVHVKAAADNSSNSYQSPVSVGGKEEIAVQDIPQSVSVITQRRIQDQNLVSVIDALRQTTGVTIIANETTQSQARARGYSLGVWYDGIPAYNTLSGYQQLDLAVYDRVETLRGPAGLLNGSGDPGGVVNLVRKRAQADFALSASATVGSWNNYRSEVDATGALNADKTLRGRAVLVAQDNDYFYDKTRTRKWVGYGTLAWDMDRASTLTLSATAQDDKTQASYSGLPAWASGGLLQVPRSTNTIADWSRSKWNTQEYTTEFDRRFDNEWVFKSKLSYRPQDQYFKDGYPTTGVDAATQALNYARRVRDYTYDRKALDLFATGPFTLLGRRHNLLLGYNRENLSTVYSGATATAVTGVPLNRTDLVPDFDIPYNLGGDTRTTQSGFYGQTRLSLTDPLTLVLGGRVSDFNTKSRNVAPAKPTNWSQGAQARNEFTPYAGLVHHMNKEWTLYGSYADVFNPQTNQYADGSTLPPRVGRQWELGTKAQWLDGKLNASLAYFNLRDRNRAYADPDHPDFYLAAGEVESKGWELEVSGRPAPGYEFTAGYTRLDTTYLRDRKNQGLPFTTWEPRHTLKLWGVHRFSEGALQGMTAGLGALVASKSAAGTGSSAARRQGGYAVVNAVLSYQINRQYSLSMNINNLFDRTYYTRLGGTNTYNTYGDPRNVSLTLRATY